MTLWHESAHEVQVNEFLLIKLHLQSTSKTDEVQVQVQVSITDYSLILLQRTLVVPFKVCPPEHDIKECVLFLSFSLLRLRQRGILPEVVPLLTYSYV